MMEQGVKGVQVCRAVGHVHAHSLACICKSNMNQSIIAYHLCVVERAATESQLMAGNQIVFAVCDCAASSGHRPTHPPRGHFSEASSRPRFGTPPHRHYSPLLSILDLKRCTPSRTKASLHTALRDLFCHKTVFLATQLVRTASFSPPKHCTHATGFGLLQANSSHVPKFQLGPFRNNFYIILLYK